MPTISLPRSFVLPFRAAIVAVLISSVPALAQENLYPLHGSTAGEQFGISVADVGDVDEDGVRDFIVGAPGYDSGKGKATVYSGVTAEPLYSVYGSTGYEGLGTQVSGLGDVNTDGIPDFIVTTTGTSSFASCPPTGTTAYVIVCSGATGGTLYSVSGNATDFFGHTIAKLGDINSDGKSDFAVGAPTSTRNNSCLAKGQVFLYSGANGAAIGSALTGSTFGDHFGEAISAVGDVNSDSVSDFAVATNSTYSDTTQVYSGANRNLLYSVSGGGVGGLNQLAGIGDVNSDGVPDFAKALPGFHVKVYSGSNGSLLYTVNPESTEAFGSPVAAIGDYNDDGVPDFAAGAPTGSSYVKVLSGSNGATLKRYGTDTSSSPLPSFGASLTGVGDITGDGVPDIIFGVPGDDTRGMTNNGSVRVPVLPGPPNAIDWFSAFNYYYIQD